MWKHASVWLTTSVLVVAAVACGGSSDSNDSSGSNGSGGSGGGTADGLPLEEVPSAYAAAYCEVARRCNPIVSILLPEQDCQAYFESAFVNRGFDDIVDAVDDGRAEYDGELMRDCVAQVSEFECDELDGPEPEACQMAAVGSVARGEDCTTDVECEGDSTCSFSDSCPGTCSARLSAGDACLTDDQCRDGLLCSGDTRRCVQPAGDGDACEGGDAPPCASHLFCLGSDEDAGTQGTCVSPDETFSAAPGEACNLTEGPLCEDGSACVIDEVDLVEGSASFVCTPVVGPGEDCRLGFLNPCEIGYFCAGTSFDTLQFDGTCEPHGEPGDECDATQLGACGFTAYCGEQTARCVERKDNGVSCDADAECWSEHCVDGGCAPTSACQE